MSVENDFGEKLKSILSDPDSLARITAIASSLGATSQGTRETKETSGNALSDTPSDTPEAAQPLLPMPAPDLLSGDPRLALLSSIKPLLREEKRDRIDALVRAMTVASMMKSFRK